MRVRLRGHHPLRPGIQPGSPHTRYLSLTPGTSAPGHTLPRHRGRNPRRVSHDHGLAIIRFRSPLLTEYPLLQVLRCFTSLRTPRQKRCQPMTAGGLPHSETLGSKPCRRLPEDYRGPTRPSSVLSAKASTTAPFTTTNPPARRPVGDDRREHTTKNTTNVSNWNTRLSDHHTHQPHPAKGTWPTRNKRTNTHTRQPRTDASRPHRPPQRWTMRLGSFTVRTPTTPLERAWPLLASTLQFSNHHHTTNPHDTTSITQGPWARNTHPRRGVAVRGPNSMHHTTTRPQKPENPRSLPHQHGTTPTHRAGNRPSHNRTPHRRPAKTP